MCFDLFAGIYCIDCFKKTLEHPVALFTPDGRLIGCTEESLCKRAQALTAPPQTALETHFANGEAICSFWVFGQAVPASVFRYIHAVIGYAVERGIFLSGLENSTNEQIYFVSQLTTIRQSLEEELNAIATQLKYNIHRDRAAILFSIRESSRSKDAGFYDNHIKQSMHWIVTLCSDFDTEDIIGVLNAYEFIVFKACPPDQPETILLERFAQRVITDIERYCGLSLIAGIGSIYGAVTQLRSSYQEAKFVVSYFDFLCPDDKSCCKLVGNHIFDYLSSTLKDQYLTQKFKPYEDALAGKKFLKDTLIQLSIYDMNLLKAADALKIHRNTIQQRFTRIKELLHTDPLSCDKDRMQLRQYALYCNRKKVLNIGICIQDDSALHNGCRKFSELLFEKTDGMMIGDIRTILLSANNDLMLELLKNGSLDLIIIDAHSLETVTEGKVLAFDLPFLFDSAEEANTILDGEIGQYIKKWLEPHGLICLAYFSTGFRYISTRSRFITCPQDLAALKIRIMHKPILEAYFKSMGAEPVMASYADVYSLLQKGVIDSQENPYANFLGMKFYDHQKCISEIPLSYGVGCFMTSQQFMQQFTPHQQKLITQAAEEACKWHRQFLIQFNDKSRDTLVHQYGVQIYPMEKQPLRAWRASARPLYKAYQDQKTLNRIMEAKKKYHAQGSLPLSI